MRRRRFWGEHDGRCHPHSSGSDFFRDHAVRRSASQPARPNFAVRSSPGPCHGRRTPLQKWCASRGMSAPLRARPQAPRQWLTVELARRLLDPSRQLGPLDLTQEARHLGEKPLAGLLHVDPMKKRSGSAWKWSKPLSSRWSMVRTTLVCRAGVRRRRRTVRADLPDIRCAP